MRAQKLRKNNPDNGSQQTSSQQMRAMNQNFQHIHAQSDVNSTTSGMAGDPNSLDTAKI